MSHDHKPAPPPPDESQEALYQRVRYYGFLSGYVVATGRNIAFAVPNRPDVLDEFNTHWQKGHVFGAGLGPNGLIEAVLAERDHRFCGNCAATRDAVNGGRRIPPKLAASVAVICRPD